MSESAECQHLWMPVFSPGRPLKYRINRMINPATPVAPVRCTRCGARTWMTKAQLENLHD